MSAGGVRGRAPAALKAFFAGRWKRLAISVGLVGLFFGNQGFRALVRNYLELRKLNKEIAALELDEKDNAARLRLLKSGDADLERMARRELGYVRKGEIEYRFPPPSPERASL